MSSLRRRTVVRRAIVVTARTCVRREALETVALSATVAGRRAQSAGGRVGGRSRSVVQLQGIGIVLWHDEISTSKIHPRETAALSGSLRLLRPPAVRLPRSTRNPARRLPRSALLQLQWNSDGRILPGVPMFVETSSNGDGTFGKRRNVVDECRRGFVEDPLVRSFERGRAAGDVDEFGCCWNFNPTRIRCTRIRR